MRRALAALALILVPLPAQAQAEQVRLVWDAANPEGTQAVLVIRSADGNELIVERSPVPSGSDAATMDLPPLPRAAETVQAGLVAGGRVIQQSAVRPVSDRAGGGLELRLRGALALGFADLWRCEDDELLRITHTDAGPMLERAGDVWPMQADADNPDILRSGPDLELQLDGNEARLSLEDRAPLTCAPSLFRPLLPLQATAHDGTWHVDMNHERALLVRPDQDDLTIPAAELIAEAERTGAISLRANTFTLDLREGRCFLQGRNMPYPLTARFALQTGPVTAAGCAGSPLQLIAGPSWFATSIFGRAPEAVDGGPTPEMTLQISENQISGRGTCNRYVGRARVEAGRVVLAELGTTRLACPLHKQNLELRFLDALEVTTGFELSADGLLILRSGHLPVLTARQR